MLLLEKSKFIKRIVPLIFLPIGLIISTAMRLLVYQHMEWSYINPRLLVRALQQSSIVLVISSCATLLTITFIRNFPKSFLLSFCFSTLTILVFQFFIVGWFYGMPSWDFVAVFIILSLVLFQAFPIIILTSFGITLAVRKTK